MAKPQGDAIGTSVQLESWVWWLSSCCRGYNGPVPKIVGPVFGSPVTKLPSQTLGLSDAT